MNIQARAIPSTQEPKDLVQGGLLAGEQAGASSVMRSRSRGGSVERLGLASTPSFPTLALPDKDQANAIRPGILANEMEDAGDRRLTLRETVIWRKKEAVGSGPCNYLVFNKHDSYLYEMSGTGICILTLCDGHNTSRQIATYLLNDLKLVHLTLGEILAFIAECLQMALLSNCKAGKREE